MMEGSCQCSSGANMFREPMTQVDVAVMGIVVDAHRRISLLCTRFLRIRQPASLTLGEIDTGQWTPPPILFGAVSLPYGDIKVLRVSITVRKVRTCSVSFPWLIRFLIVTF